MHVKPAQIRALRHELQTYLRVVEAHEDYKPLAESLTGTLAKLDEFADDTGRYVEPAPVQVADRAVIA